MKIRKKRRISEEEYWKSATDIMSGVLLVILLVLMLLLLYITQFNKENSEHKADHDWYYAGQYDQNNTNPTDTVHDYDNIDRRKNNNTSSGGGGGGGGDDDPGVETPGNPDEGHDKTAVLVTAVDEETGNAIKKEGTLFELYSDKGSAGGIKTLHTYYPKKVEYKQYKTTSNGTFYLPEKITRGWYSLHNLTPPNGYGKADDYEFEVTESLDWPEPLRVKIPFSPSKNKIYVTNIDAETEEEVGGQTYTVYAAEDIVTLDGTVRYKSGQEVDEFKCDKYGKGSSKKLYLGKYYLIQKNPAQYYARYTQQLDVELKLTDTDNNAVEVKCEKTQVSIFLKDEYSNEAVVGAVYSVTDKGNVTTEKNGKLSIINLDKNKEYTVRLESLPEPYRSTIDTFKFHVDKDGNISGKPLKLFEQTAYIIRLSVDIKDMIFKNSVSGAQVSVVDSSGKSVDEWDTVGEAHEIEGLEPGEYFLVTNNDSDSKVRIHLKDNGKLQKAQAQIWTLWDTILVSASVVAAAVIIFLLTRLARYRRRKKSDEH